MTETDSVKGAQGSAWARRGTKNPAIILGLLFLLNTFLVLDKIIFTILLEPIKLEFQLNDLQLGLLAGAVYAVFMGLASLPFGLAADRLSRRGLAAACLAAWSGMTALCGMAQSFTVLLLARLGVGVGEAGGGPAALSMISDLYEHKKRATAMAIFSLGTSAASLINLTVNTQIVHMFGWRMALIFAAVPGLVLAIIIWLFIAEPKRNVGDSKTPLADGEEQSTKAPPLKTTFKFILKQRSLVHLLIGGMIAYIVLAGVSSWNFSYLVRQHNVKLHEIGVILGLSISSAGMLGLYIAGRLADFLAERDERWRAWIMAFTTLCSVGFGYLTFTTPSLALAILGTAGIATCATLWLAPGFALCQGLVLLRMRGTIGSIMFLLANLVGYGIGPLLVGFLSDLFAGQGMANSLQWAVLTVMTGNIWAAVHFMLVGRTLRADLVRSGTIADPALATT